MFIKNHKRKMFWNGYELTGHRINKGHLELLGNHPSLVIAAIGGQWDAMYDVDIWDWIREQPEFEQEDYIVFKVETKEGTYISEYPETLVAFYEFYSNGFSFDDATYLAQFAISVFLSSKYEFSIASFCSLLIQESKNGVDIVKEYAAKWLSDKEDKEFTETIKNITYQLFYL